MDAVFNRRSIRKFLSDPIPEEDIKRILMAGMAAPSAKDSQEWVFIRITAQDTVESLLEIHPNAFAMRTAPLNLLVCADLRACKMEGDWWVLDGAAALENMLIESTALGYGSLWIGIHPSQERVNRISALCALPDYIRPIGILAAGRTDKVKPPHDRYLSQRVYLDRYEERGEA